MKLVYGKWHISLQFGLTEYPVRVYGIGWWNGCSKWWLPWETHTYEGLHYSGFRIGPFYYSQVL